METKSLRIVKFFEVLAKINHIIRIIMVLFLTEGLFWILNKSRYVYGGGDVMVVIYWAPILLLDMLALVLFLLATIILLISIRNPYKLIIRIAYKEFAIESGKTLLASILAIAIPEIVIFSKH